MKNIIKTTLALFFLLLGSFAFAQHMSVSSFRCMENDLTARVANVEDINNELCALIKVSLPLSGVEFSGTGLESYEQNTGRCLQTLTGHTDYVWSASYSPDGTKIVSASGDNTIKIWGLE